MRLAPFLQPGPSIRLSARTALRIRSSAKFATQCLTLPLAQRTRRGEKRAQNIVSNPEKTARKPTTQAIRLISRTEAAVHTRLARQPPEPPLKLIDATCGSPPIKRSACYARRNTMNVMTQPLTITVWLNHHVQERDARRPSGSVSS